MADDEEGSETMSEKKDTAGEDKEPRVRGKSGPASSTPNEEKRGSRKDNRVPKIGKHETGKRGSGGSAH